MRLIDADALDCDLQKLEQDYRKSYATNTRGDMIELCRKRIDMMPTLDAVPVLRCKDCAYARRWYSDRYLCDLWDKDGIDVFGDGFCNYGKRKEEDEVKNTTNWERFTSMTPEQIAAWLRQTTRHRSRKYAEEWSKRCTLKRIDDG